MKVEKKVEKVTAEKVEKKVENVAAEKVETTKPTEPKKEPLKIDEIAKI